MTVHFAVCFVRQPYYRSVWIVCLNSYFAEHRSEPYFLGEVIKDVPAHTAGHETVFAVRFETCNRASQKVLVIMECEFVANSLNDIVGVKVSAQITVGFSGLLCESAS